MSGAMRRIGEYLGLVEDTGRYDEYDGHDETVETRPVASPRAARPAPVSDLSERRRPTAAPTPVVAELSRITTLHPSTYNEARTVGEHFREGAPGAYPHNDARRHNAEECIRYSPLFRNDIFWAAKWEVRADRSDRGVAKRTDQWVQEERSTRLAALWLHGLRTEGMANGWEVSRCWGALREAPSGSSHPPGGTF